MFFEKEFNFGLVEQQKSITHVFEFQNGGGDTLVIGKIESPWGCTVGTVVPDKIPSGKKGHIEVTFNSKQYKGEVKRTIYIHSNDSTNASFPLTIIATVSDPSQWMTNK